jgi:hypothetical protein
VGVLRECVTEGSNTDDASQARLTSLAARFEDNVYRSAKTNEEYFHQIANKMYNLKRKKAVPGGGGDLAKAGASAAAPPPQGVPIGRPTARTDSVLRRPTTRLRDRLRYDRLMIVCCVLCVVCVDTRTANQQPGAIGGQAGAGHMRPAGPSMGMPGVQPGAGPGGGMANPHGAMAAGPVGVPGNAGVPAKVRALSRTHSWRQPLHVEC